jgi:hypothetical protein
MSMADVDYSDRGGNTHTGCESLRVSGLHALFHGGSMILRLAALREVMGHLQGGN